MTTLLALCDPEYAKQHDSQLMAEAKQLSTYLQGMKEVKIVQQQIDETAFITVNLTVSTGRGEAGKFRLKKVSGQWRLTSVYF